MAEGFNERPKYNSKNMCSWCACQKQRAPGLCLCEEHVRISKVLGLKVYPAGVLGEDLKVDK